MAGHILDNGRACLSNNAAERALRGFALGRKAWLFAGAERAAGMANQLAGWKAEQSLASSNAAGIGQAVGSLAGLLFQSDADAKEDKKPGTGMLEAVRGLPVQEWSYKPGEGDGGRHIGTYAQDFQRETGKGDGRSIPVIDAIGVTMGAIKELDKKVDRLAKGRGIGSMPGGG